MDDERVLNSGGNVHVSACGEIVAFGWREMNEQRRVGKRDKVNGGWRVSPREAIIAMSRYLNLSSSEMEIGLELKKEDIIELEESQKSCPYTHRQSGCPQTRTKLYHIPIRGIQNSQLRVQKAYLPINNTLEPVYEMNVDLGDELYSVRVAAGDGRVVGVVRLFSDFRESREGESDFQRRIDELNAIAEENTREKYEEYDEYQRQRRNSVWSRVVDWVKRKWVDVKDGIRRWLVRRRDLKAASKILVVESQGVQTRSSTRKRPRPENTSDDTTVPFVFPYAASYLVYPIHARDPSHLPRQVLTNPWDTYASPIGWQKDTDGLHPFTRGNNVLALHNHANFKTLKEFYNASVLNTAYASVTNITSNSNGITATSRNVVIPKFDFNFPIHETHEPNTYVDASLTQLFYLLNRLHDLFYHFGFDELSGNFQFYNFQRGGLESDFVIAIAQDGSGKNNARFLTPPDGHSPRLITYLADYTKPYRDIALANDVIIHETVHGVTTRLSGGPSNVNCLKASVVSRGLGEGWSDFVACALQVTDSSQKNYVCRIGGWISDHTTSLRSYPVSLSRKVAPLMYKDVVSFRDTDEHEIGVIWSLMLWEVLWELVGILGWDGDWMVSERGNTVMMQLVIDGLKLQPCEPDFISARDAILQAERIRCGGVYQCVLWKAFAARGLGVNAKGIVGDASGSVMLEVRNDFSVPKECRWML